MRANPTDAEKRIWSLLRAKRMVGHKFRRQVVIDSYIVDFVCFHHRLIIEVDGGQHSENDYDERRDAYLRRQGFRVSRFWNNDVLGNTEGVGAAILEALASPLPPNAARRAPPSPARGEGLVEEPSRMLA